MGDWIEIHIHTRASSHDSFLTYEELIREVRELELNGICLTEHLDFADVTPHRLESAYASYYEMKNRLAADGVRVFPGIELKTEGGAEFLVLGAVLPLDLFSLSWDMALEEIRTLGGISIQAHPFRHETAVSAAADGVELYNARNTAEANKKCREWTSRHPQNPFIVGSDAHFADELGRAVTVFKNTIETDRQFTEAIRSRDYEGFIISGKYYKYGLNESLT